MDSLQCQLPIICKGWILAGKPGLRAAVLHLHIEADNTFFILEKKKKSTYSATRTEMFLYYSLLFPKQKNAMGKKVKSCQALFKKYVGRQNPVYLGSGIIFSPPDSDGKTILTCDL